MLHRPQPDADDDGEDYWEQRRTEDIASIQWRRVAARVANFKRNYLTIWVPDTLETLLDVHQPLGGFWGYNSHPQFMTEDAYREFRRDSYYRAGGWNHQMAWDMDPQSRERTLYDCYMVVYRYLNQIRSWNRRVLRNLPPEPLPPRDRSGNNLTAFLYAV
jgi:hypothetical protein